MPLIDFDKLAKEYETEDDFGFSAVSEEEYNSVVNKTAETADDYKLRLHEVEKIIIPFLRSRLDSAALHELFLQRIMLLQY